MSQLINCHTLPVCLEDLTTPYGIACTLFCGRLVRDRFNFLNKYSSLDWVETIDPIPNNSSESLSNLMDKRACEFLGKSITVQWSGGVDSTSLLLALIKNGVSKEDLIIRYDINSQEEYPLLCDWLIKNKYQMVPVKQSWHKALSTTDTDIIINGWCADQLFGSVFFYSCPELYSVDLNTLLDKVTIENISLTQKNKEKAINVFKRYGKEFFDIDISTAADLGWFINFTLKWTYVSLFNEMYLIGTKNQFNTHPFYNTSYFQSWALSNFPTINNVNIYSSPRDYKRDLKEYCNEIFPDPEYLNNKCKKPSWNSSQDRTAVTDRRVILKTTEGYEIHTSFSNIITPSPISIEQRIFTKYKK